MHYQHGVGRFGGMVRRSIGGVERDYLLLEYKSGDKLYVPSDQVDLLRPYTGGESPALSRLNGTRLAAGQVPGPGRRPRDRPGAGRALPDAGQLARPRLRPGHAVAARDGGVVPLQRDARSAEGHRGRQGRHGGRRPHGPPGLRRRRLRQDRGRHPGRLQGRPGRQAGGRPGPDHPAGLPALPDLLRSLRRLPGPGRDAVPVPDARPGPPGGRRPGRRVGRHRHRHPPAPVGRPRSSRISACWSSTRSSASGSTTRRPSRSCAPTSTCSPSPPPRSRGPSR